MTTFWLSHIYIEKCGLETCHNHVEIIIINRPPSNEDFNSEMHSLVKNGHFATSPCD
jgi:hypothetical protein